MIAGLLISAALAAEPPARRPPEITVHMTPPGEVFADRDGLTLYVFDRDTEPNVSTCVDACAQAWPPVRAGADAMPFDDWTLVDRKDGARQWAYKGKPLYRYAMEQKPGWAAGDGGGAWNLALTSWIPIQRNTGRAAAGPPPEAPIALPPVPAGVTGQKSARGPVLADHRGLTLYAVEQQVKDGAPLRAPLAALPVGEWTVIDGPDGARQWAYRAKAVYTCAKDKKPGDTECDLGAIGPWHALTP